MSFNQYLDGLKPFREVCLDTETTDTLHTAKIMTAALRVRQPDGAIDEHEITFRRYVTDVTSPMAAAVNGIEPSRLREQGSYPHAGMLRVFRLLMPSGDYDAPALHIGYNTDHFDNQVIFHSLYRTGLDPYGWTWHKTRAGGYVGGGSPGKFDVYKAVVALAAAGAPGLRFSLNEKASPRLRLGQVCEANGISAEGAHDAMVDVRMTARLLDLIREREPRYYRYALNNMATKSGTMGLMHLGEPLLHIARYYGWNNRFTDIIQPLCVHPSRSNAFLCLRVSRCHAGDERGKGGLAEQLRRMDPDDIARTLLSGKSAVGKRLKTTDFDQFIRMSPKMALSAQMQERFQGGLAAAREIAADMSLVGKLRDAAALLVEPQRTASTLTGCLLDLYGQPFMSRRDAGLCRLSVDGQDRRSLHEIAASADEPGRVYAMLLYKRYSPLLGDFMNDLALTARDHDEIYRLLRDYLGVQVSSWTEFCDYVTLAQEMAGPIADFDRNTDEGPLVDRKEPTIGGFLAEASALLSDPDARGLERAQCDVIESWQGEIDRTAQVMNAMTAHAISDGVQQMVDREMHNARFMRNVHQVRTALPETRFIGPDTIHFYLINAFCPINRFSSMEDGDVKTKRDTMTFEMDFGDMGRVAASEGRLIGDRADVGRRDEQIGPVAGDAGHPGDIGPQDTLLSGAQSIGALMGDGAALRGQEDGATAGQTQQAAQIPMSTSLSDFFLREETADMVKDYDINGFFGSPVPAMLIHYLLKSKGIKSEVRSVGADEDPPMSHFVCEFRHGGKQFYACEGGVFEGETAILDFCAQALGNNRKGGISARGVICKRENLRLGSPDETREAQKTVSQLLSDPEFRATGVMPYVSQGAKSALRESFMREFGTRSAKELLGDAPRRQMVEELTP